MPELHEINSHLNQLILELDNNHGITITKKVIEFIPKKAAVEVHFFFTYEGGDKRWDYEVYLDEPVHHESLERQFMEHLAEHLKEEGRGMEEIQ